MAYIYKKKIHGKVYYYLRVSKRVKGKIVVKDVAYLGHDASKLDDKFKELPVIYKKEIRKAYRNIKKFIQEEYYLRKVQTLKLKKSEYLSKDAIHEIEAIKLHFNEVFLQKDKITIQEAYENFLIDFAYNTTSLEGNTITLQETDKLLKENLTPKNRTLREIYDLQNTEKTFFDIINLKEDITQKLIIDLHSNLMQSIDKRKGYRTHDIRVFKSRFKASPFPYIKADIENLMHLYKQYKNKMHPLVLASIFHQKFEKIHPFSDGNGRTGRMLLCYMLLKAGYPPLIIKKLNREKYLDALGQGNQTDLNNIEPKHFKKLVQYIVDELISSYWNSFNI